jgi:hypothetical protein
MLRCFTTPCSTSSWYTGTPVSPPDGTPPTKPWHRKGDSLPATSERISKDVWAWILLYWLYCSSMVKIFSSVKRTFSCPFSACHWRGRFALVHHTSFKVGVTRCPFEWRCALMCRSSLMRHDLIGSICSAFNTTFCFQSGFQQICSRTILIAASALTLFRHPDRVLSSTLQSSLYCLIAG